MYIADRASSDIAQLLRRFENLVALAPVSSFKTTFLFFLLGGWVDR